MAFLDMVESAPTDRPAGAGATPRLGIAEIKTRLTIPEAWRALGLPGNPARTCKSPLREDRNPSFSIYQEGRRFRDFASGDHGDVIDFVRLALKVSPPEALAWCRERCGSPTQAPTVARARTSSPSHAAGTKSDVEQMRRPPTRAVPPEILADWSEGVAWLEFDTAMQAQIEQWRAWPTGTVLTLARMGLIGAPRVRGGDRCLAFPVQAPRRDGWVLCGFHARHEPRKMDTRASWEYLPRGITSWPYVVAGFSGGVQFAKLIIVTEGQWDLVTFFAAAGWLAHEHAIPARIAGVAIRGAAGWRTPIATWSRFWSRRASVLVLPDGDAAGEKWWKGDADFCKALASMSRRVRVFPISAGAAGKDFNDVHRAQPFTPDSIRQLLIDSEILNAEGLLL